MGFITPAEGGADLFVHRSNLVDGESLALGSQVMYQPGFDERKGKPIATMCMGAVPAPPGCGRGGGVVTPAPREVEAMRSLADNTVQHTGTVKAWYEDRGMGFITPDGGLADVFAHRSNFMDGASLVPGARVKFTMGWDVQKNKGIARNIFGAVPSRMAGATGVHQVGLPGNPPPPPSAPQPLPALAASAPSAAPAEPGSRTGLVKIWFEEKSFGFITPHDGTMDVFVHRSALQGVSMLFQGSTVTFTSRWDSQNNKEIAATCRVSEATAGMQAGTVKVWFEDRGFGFITNNDGSGDAFVHRAALMDGGSLQAGAQVYFESQYNAIKQKSTATKVIGAVPSPTGGLGATAGVSVTDDPSDNIFIGGLPLTSTEDFIRQVFNAYGAVMSCKVLPANGRPDLAALVRMADVEQAKWLVDNVNNNIPVGLTTPVSVRFAKSQGERAPNAKPVDARFSPYGLLGATAAPVLTNSSVPDSWKTLAAAPPPKMSSPAPVVGAQPGVVKAWYEERGMGFITPNAGGEDIFVHRTALTDGQTLVLGSTVTFEPGWDAQKNKAIATKCSGAVPAPGAGLGAISGADLAALSQVADSLAGGTIDPSLLEQAVAAISSPPPPPPAGAPPQALAAASQLPTPGPPPAEAPPQAAA